MDNTEQLTRKARSAGLWFAVTSFTGQAISWVFTFYVIRLLDPKDFGLMTMASLLTAYLQMFGELGVGATIIHKSEVDQKFLSTAFWLVLFIGTLLGGATLILAYPTAWIFSNSELIPVTQFISILFVVSALSTVPYHLLARNFQFKTIGTINLIAMLVASVLSVVLALKGYGVYTLIWTNICQSSIKLLLFFLASKWKPSLHFAVADIKETMGYGITMALSGTAVKLYQTLDKLVIGRFFGANPLGYYQNAITISSMPLDKVWPIFQQILFPLFSRAREDASTCAEIYLHTLKHYLLIVAPIYLGCAIVADNLILVMLGEKWAPLAPLLQIFCFVKIFQVLTSYHVVLDNTTGHHKSALYFNFASATLIPALMWSGAQLSFKSAIYPWMTVYPLLCGAWLFWSLRKNSISILAYLKTVAEGFMAAVIMFAGLALMQSLHVFSKLSAGMERLSAQIGVGVILFAIAVLFLQKSLLLSTIQFLRKKPSPLPD